ncbi:MAG: hypothetical protein IJ099_02545 [Alphaproteobacteria bacterium]|nr:hypothetical protein [Alphaproteobacteria bacterium]
MIKFADLTYSEEELTQDAIHFLETAVYEPGYVDKVKEFVDDDLADFTLFFNDDKNVFCNIYSDEYQKGYVTDGNNVVPRADFRYLSATVEDLFRPYDVDDEEIERYVFALDTEFRKNAYCSHMEPFFVGEDAVIATVMIGYARNPLFSIYSMVREWAMAMHFKYMYPEAMRKFGYRYQLIKNNFSGEERLRRLITYRDKYKLTLQNIGSLRAIHSSVFAYVYLYLKAVQTHEVLTAEQFILDSSTSQIYLLLQGEAIQNIDYPVVHYALEKLKEGEYKKLFNADGSINWLMLYAFVFDAIKNVGNTDKLRYFGFDSIEARAIQSFWNKSANMQSMLKILRRLAMDNSDPIINQLIEMCEYRLGRPNHSKEKMEQFIEETRKILLKRAFELTQPRTMDQTLIAAFPSVFLVYFQWHHNLRTIYPKVPKKQVEENNLRMQKTQAEDKLKNRIYADDVQKVKFREVAKDRTNRQETERTQRNKTDDERLRMHILTDSERQKLRDDRQKEEQSRQQNATLISERVQKQNSL